MTGLDLRPYVDRSRALLESSPPSSARETRTLLVDPFLESLGWDVRADDCRTNETVDGTRLEYVFAADGVPALLVAVDPYEETLEESRAVSLLEVMAWSGVDRAIYTNGRDYLFLAGTTDADRLACRLPSLSEYESSIAHYSRTAIERHLERHTREFVARRLALERSALVDSFVDRLTGLAAENEAYADEFETAAERFLDQLVVSFAGGETDFASDSGDVALEFTDATAAGDRTGSVDAAGTVADAVEPAPDGTRPEDGDGDGANPATEAATDDEVEPSVEPTTGSDELEEGPDGSVGDADAPTGDGEYVVRFFNDRGSIGAIGGSSSAAALFHAAEYLLERGLSGIDVPWCPDDSDRVVINDEPTGADGSSMTSPHRLSNGLYLETGGDATAHAERVEELAARAGLRAMLTGDWE